MTIFSIRSCFFSWLPSYISISYYMIIYGHRQMGVGAFKTCTFFPFTVYASSDMIRELDGFINLHRL